MSRRSLIIGARRSPLARVQAQATGAALLRAGIAREITYRFIESSGDRSAEPSAAKVTARGGFTADLGQLLDDGAIDLAVHSWKDLPLADRPGTDVVATLPRADARDVLLIRRSSLTGSSIPNLTILSSSERRRRSLESFLHWALPVRIDAVRFVPVRGDIGTRLTKLLRGDGDALVIAKAAIDRLLCTRHADPADAGLDETRERVRLALASCRAIVLPLASSPAAPGQGALAIETRRDAAALQSALATVNDADTFELVQRERDLASGMSGDVEPVGVTRLRFAEADVEFVRGSRGDQIENRVALHRRAAGLPRPHSAEAVWIGDDEGSVALERLPIAARLPALSERTGLLVARAEALPPDVALNDAVVWTAGLATWRKLAARGVWVTGSDESLGETGAVAIREWFPQITQWLKLSHAEGYEPSLATLLPTYRIRRTAPLASLHSRTHFFWNSGSQLRAYLAAFPGLAQAWHGCGPGNSLRIARDLLGADRVQPFLNGGQFREELLA